MLIAFIAVLAILIILFLMNFYRDPERVIPKGNNIVAPADGKIISIINTSKNSVNVGKGLIGKVKTLTSDVADQCHIVSIFMSPFDVHINRSPVTGTITSIKHSKGNFFKAYDFERSLQNEKNEILIQKGKLKVKVIQIAGFLARRIICKVRKNQKVNKGQKIGMIALGSQTTIILPIRLRLKIKLRDKVKAGETIIADMK